jgi:capsular polysaccharide transport system ATP-binding protein
MIELQGVGKEYPTRRGPRRVLDDVTFTVRPGERLGVLGVNGAGKSTLIRLVAGVERPTEGQIRRGMSVSWPLAFSGAFQNSLTAYDNLRFICRVYGADVEEKLRAALEFSELGDKFWEPVRTFSSGQRARLAFAISLSVEFDCFLIDEIIAVGDQYFQEKCNKALFVDRADRAMIIASHHPYFIREHCNRVVVLHDGHARSFESVDDAFAYYEDAHR